MPAPASNGDITILLNEWRHGSSSAENALFHEVNVDLRRIARRLINRERKGHSLQATELVDQVYFRLVSAKDRDWRNRQHFFALAARAMRQYLIDQARARPDAQFVAIEKLDGCLPASSQKLEFAITLDRFLNQLGQSKPELCSLVELKYFLGMTDEEVAEILGLKLRTMQRMWRDARQWLFEQMQACNGRHHPS